jgi:membrane protein YqaA with SNARE-associated domain
MVFDAVTLIMSFGYLGLFVSSIISSLSLFFPLPGFALVIAAGAFLNPFWIGIVAGVGSAIGEMIGYPIGRGIHYGYTKRKQKKRKKSRFEKDIMKAIKDWFDKKRGPLIIFIFAVTPLPDDFVVIFCGLIKYDIKKLFFSLLIGKIIFSLALAYAGFYGIKIAEGFL